MAERTLVAGDGPVTAGLAEWCRATGRPVQVLPVVADRDRVFADVGAAGPIDTAALVIDRAGPPRPLVECSTEQWSRDCEQLMDGALWFFQAVHAPLASSGGHLVVVLPTIGGSGAAGAAGLATATEAVHVLAKGAAKQWGADGITVNVVAVSPSLLWAGDTAAAMQAGQSLNVPALGHTGDVVTDLGPVIGLLDGDDAHFVTGATVLADGGVWTV